MKTDKNISKALRVILGLFLIVYALNQFLHFLPSGYGDMPVNARDFLDGVAIYLPYLYMFEIIIGLFLIFNKWTSFILIVLFPLSLAFLMFVFSNGDMSKIWTALVVGVLNIILLLNRSEIYKPLFK